MKKIAFILPDLIAGGAQRVVLNLCKELSNRAYQVDLLVISNPGTFFDKVSPGVNLIRLNDSESEEKLGVSQVFKAANHYRTYLKDNSPDIIVSSLTGTNLFTLVIKLITKNKTPLVAIEHSVVRNIHSAIKKMLVKWFYPRADRIICVSDGIRQDLTSIGIPAKNIIVINNPIDIEQAIHDSQQDISHPWLLDKSVTAIVAIGRLVEAKGFDQLIRAFALLLENRPAKLLILGDGPLKPGLLKLCADLGVDKDVDLPGHVDNPYAYLARADLFVLSSNWEGFVGVLVEAMALGVPVVACDCWTSPREILKDGEIGILAPNNQPETLKQFILLALDNPQDRELLAKRASDFSISKITDQYIGQLKKITVNKL